MTNANHPKNRNTDNHRKENAPARSNSRRSLKSSRPFYIRVVALIIAILMVLGVVVAGINSFRY